MADTPIETDKMNTESWVMINPEDHDELEVNDDEYDVCPEIKGNGFHTKRGSVTLYNPKPFNKLSMGDVRKKSYCSGEVKIPTDEDEGHSLVAKFRFYYRTEAILKMEDTHIQLEQATQKVHEPLKHYTEMFQFPCHHVVAVSGEGGIGKTVFTDKIIQDWVSEDENPMKSFACVFNLSFRKWKRDHSLIESVVYQSLGERDLDISDDIHHLLKRKKKVLFCVQLDELVLEHWYELETFIKNNSKNGAFFVLETGPFNVFDSKIKHIAPFYINIKGLTMEKIQSIAIRNFSKSKDLDTAYHMSSELVIFLQDFDMIGYLNHNLLQHLCDTLIKTKLSESLSDVYLTMCNMILCSNANNAKRQEKRDEIFHYLGKLACESLSRGESMVIPSFADKAEVAGESIFEMSLLVPQSTLSRQKHPDYVFVHDSIGLFLSAIYIGHEYERGNQNPWQQLSIKVSSLQTFRKYELFLLFCTGTSKALAQEIFRLSETVAFISDQNVQKLKEILTKVSLDKSLSIEEVICGHNFRIHDNLQFVLNFQMKCLMNSKYYSDQNCLANNIIDFGFKPAFLKKLFDSGKIIATNSFLIFPAKCDMDALVKYSKGMSWLVLELQEQNDWQVPMGKFKYSPFYCKIKSAEMHNNASSLQKLLCCLAKNKNIQHIDLDLHESQLTEEEWETIFKLLLKFKKVSGLDLSYCNIFLGMLPKLGNILVQNSQFHSLQISGKLGGHFHYLTDELKTIDNLFLVRLSLAGSFLGPTDEEALKELLAKCPSLQYLYLDDCKCEVSSSVLKLNHLQELSISNTVENGASRGLNTQHLFCHLHLPEHLKTIQAEWCGINDIQIKHLKLPPSSKITIISLRRNHLGDEGLTYISGLSTCLPCLRELDVRSNKIHNSGIKSFLWNVKDFANLKHVYVINNPISKDFYLEMKEAFFWKDIILD